MVRVFQGSHTAHSRFMEMADILDFDTMGDCVYAWHRHYCQHLKSMLEHIVLKATCFQISYVMMTIPFAGITFFAGCPPNLDLDTLLVGGISVNADLCSCVNIAVSSLSLLLSLLM